MEEPELIALEGRVSKGFEVLKGMEDMGDTGARYDRLFDLWKDLLRQYEVEKDLLTDR